MSNIPKVSRAKIAYKLKAVRKYSVLIFIVFIVAVYGFILVQAKLLLSAEPSEDAIANHVESTKTLHIDPSIVKRLQELQDNSVSVKALFDKARSDPFH